MHCSRIRFPRCRSPKSTTNVQIKYKGMLWIKLVLFKFQGPSRYPSTRLSCFIPTLRPFCQRKHSKQYVNLQLPSHQTKTFILYSYWVLDSGVVINEVSHKNGTCNLLLWEGFQVQQPWNMSFVSTQSLDLMSHTCKVCTVEWQWMTACSL